MGVSIDRREQTRERDRGGSSYRDLIIELHVLGTAIVEARNDAPPPPKYIALPLDRGGPMSDEQEPYDPTSMAGVPEHGRERLERMRDRSLFTSDLSVNEFLLVQAAGFEPARARRRQLDLPRRLPAGEWSQNQEMDVLSQAMYHARELAMTRMEEEADELGADGVVGVRLEVRRYEWGDEPGRVHGHRHRRQARARASCTARPTAGRSRATCRARTSRCCSPPATARSAW